MIVVFEGLDGSGKSTQAQIFKENLEKSGKRVLLTGVFLTEYGQLIRNIFMEHQNTSMEAQIYLLGSAMCEVSKLVKQSKDYDVIILDRYVYSTYVYHGYGLNIGLKKVKSIYKYVFQNIAPDLIFLLDIPPELIYSRIAEAKDRIEKSALDFFSRVRQGYLKLSKVEQKCIVVDATQPIESVHSEIMKRYLDASDAH